jgi:hypothetical protein
VITQEGDMEQILPPDERSFFRVRGNVGMRVERVSLERWKLEEAAILADRSAPVDAVDPELAHWLERIEHKLDLVLDHLGVPNDEPLVQLQTRSVLLSGSGVRFDGDEPLHEGDRVLLWLEFEGDAAVHLRALARVTDVNGSEEGGRIEVRFDVIREIDRDRVIEYTLEMERRRIRARAGGRE